MILVIGATGTVGSEVVRQLSLAKRPCRALVRHIQKAAVAAHEHVSIVQGDLQFPETLHVALKGIERVFLVTTADPEQPVLHANLIAHATRTGVKQIVRISALGADPASPCRFLKLHGLTEQHLERSGVPFTHLRPNFYMQNTLNFSHTIVRTGAFYAPFDPQAAISMVDVGDVAAVAVKTLTEPGHEGRAYTLTGPEALSFPQVAQILTDLLGQPVRYEPIAADAFRTGLLEANMPEWLVEGMNELYALFGHGLGAAVTTTVADLLGRPARPYARFAKEFARVFRRR